MKAPEKGIFRLARRPVFATNIIKSFIISAEQVAPNLSPSTIWLVRRLAEAFKTAADNGHGPKRSIIFLHVTGEEKGLLGSRYYTDYEPLVPLKNTITDLNIDMIGRIDPKREGDRNYIYLIGSDKLINDF